MANIRFANFARSQLAAGLAAGDLTLSVVTTHGARFPTLTGAQYFYVVLENAALDREIVKVTARSGDLFTIVRAQDNTTALAWNAGDVVSLRMVAAALQDAIDAAAGGDFAELAGAVFTGDVTVPSLNGGQLAGMRNKIINGAMRVSGRGTSFPEANSYTLDRWKVAQAGGGVVKVSQQADGPNTALATSLRWEVTTADAAIAADDYAIISQKIEGYNVADLIGRPFTISFWARSSKTGTHCVALRNSGLDRSYVAEYTITAADTWEFKTITVTGGLITAGTWNWTTGTGLEVDFCLAAGTNFHTAPGAWQSGNYIGTANQVNCLDTVGNIFAITGAQLEVGEVATPFEHRPYGAELALCQRYYCETRGSVTFTAAAADNSAACSIFWPVEMRDTPATTNSGGSVTNASSANVDGVTKYGGRYVIVATAAGVCTVSNRVIKASAEL